MAVVYASEVRPSKHFIGAQHVEAALVQSPFALGWVACDSHVINVATQSGFVKCEGCCFCRLTPQSSRATKRHRLERIVSAQSDSVWCAIFVCEMPLSVYKGCRNVVVWICDLIARRSISDLQID